MPPMWPNSKFSTSSASQKIWHECKEKSTNYSSFPFVMFLPLPSTKGHNVDVN